MSPGSNTSAGETPQHVLVVVPARDEERLLPRCLGSIDRARDRLAVTHPGVGSHLLVVLDSCTDQSGVLAAAHGCVVLEVRVGAVGAARAAGVAAGRALVPVDDARDVWLASTDADSEVPGDWLSAQVDGARAGAGLLLGGVLPDPAAAPAGMLLAWRDHDRRLDASQRVHGANLGVRLSAYDAVGGFPLVAEHEDVGLVRALRRRGVPEGGCPPVLTSPRRVGRVPGGFAGYLRRLSHPAPDGGAPQGS